MNFRPFYQEPLPALLFSMVTDFHLVQSSPEKNHIELLPKKSIYFYEDICIYINLYFKDTELTRLRSFKGNCKILSNPWNDSLSELLEYQAIISTILVNLCVSEKKYAMQSSKSSWLSIFICLTSLSCLRDKA